MMDVTMNNHHLEMHEWLDLKVTGVSYILQNPVCL